MPDRKNHPAPPSGRKPYARPQMHYPRNSHEVGAILFGEFVTTAMMQCRDTRVRMWTHQWEVAKNYTIIPDGSGLTFPTLEEWIAAHERPAESCSECGCDGRRGFYHGDRE